MSTGVALVDAFDFVDGRAPGDIRVRLVDPRVTVDGWHSTGTVVQVSCDDRQFIVTTVKEELHRLGHKVTRILHPVFGSERAADGRLAAILPGPRRRAPGVVPAGRAGRPGRARGPAAAGGRLRAVLEDVFAATGDFLAMRAAGGRRRRPPPCATPPSATRPTRWPRRPTSSSGSSTTTSSSRAAARVDQGDDVVDSPRHRSSGRAVRRRPAAARRPDQPLRIVRTAEVSTVHRQVPMHRIDVVDVGPDGQVVGAFRVVGVFSRKAAAEPAVVTPVLRFKLRRILEMEDVVEGSYDEATLVSLFQVLPKEELFEADVAHPARRSSWAWPRPSSAATSRSCSRWSRPTTPCPPSSPSPRTSTPPPSASASSASSWPSSTASGSTPTSPWARAPT